MLVFEGLLNVLRIPGIGWNFSLVHLLEKRDDQSLSNGKLAACSVITKHCTCNQRHKFHFLYPRSYFRKPEGCISRSLATRIISRNLFSCSLFLFPLTSFLSPLYSLHSLPTSPITLLSLSLLSCQRGLSLSAFLSPWENYYSSCQFASLSSLSLNAIQRPLFALSFSPTSCNSIAVLLLP